MAFERYIDGIKGKLRCGYTTGTCSAIASKAAAVFLFSGKCPNFEEVLTPSGVNVKVPIAFSKMEKGKAVCGVIKDGGDDIDATNGVMILCSAEKIESGIVIEGGKGVGVVTKSGLDQPVGSAAINSVPRKMISDAIKSVCHSFGYNGGIKITVSVPEGEKIAEKTFNPNIGIKGGISIIGTSGIVEPMSLKAVFETVKLEINVARSSGKSDIIITPGNYGQDFVKTMNIKSDSPLVQCSNFIGDALKFACRKEFKNILLAGHLGKLVKLAGGMMNTHSMYGDCRMDIIGARAGAFGAEKNDIVRILNSAAVDAALDIIEGDKYVFENVVKSIILDAQKNIDAVLNDSCRCGILIFTNKRGLLGASRKADDIISLWRDI